MNRFESITKPLKWCMALLLVAIVVGCGGGGSPDTTAPSVSSIAPANLATGIALNTNIIATFSEAMDPATISTTTFTLATSAVPSAPVAGAVTYSGTAATFNPTSNLAASTSYTATVTTGVKDMAGNALAVAKTWSFTTGTTSDNTAPTVSSTAPANADTGVVKNTNITATFSETMDPATITATTFTLATSAVPSVSVAGAVTYVGTTATFNPTSDLATSTPYTATVTTGVKDLAGNVLAVTKTWSFTTGSTTAAGPAAVDLMSARDFAILAETAVTYNGTAAIPAVTGDVGISPSFAASITGFGNFSVDATNDFATASEVVGNIYAPDYTGGQLGSNGLTPAKMTAARNDMVAAYDDTAGRTPGVGATNLNLGAGTLTGLTLPPGTYTWDAGTPGGNVNITGDITLAGAAADVWIFQISGTLTQATATSILFSGPVKAKNIFWQVAGGVTLNGSAHMEGVIMSKTAITLNAGSSANSRLLAQSAVTLGGTVTQPAP